MDVLDTLSSATPLVRRVVLCLDGELQAEHDALQTQLGQIKADSLAADNVNRVVRQMEKIRERMLAAEVSFSFGALAWFRRMALQAEHPPRDGNLVDRNSGFNMETYVPALIREACRSVQGADGVTVTEVPDETWDALLAGLNYQQVNVLYAAAEAANDNATTVPLSARSLLASQDSGASSKPPGPGTSRPNASKAGSRPRRPRSSTTTKAASSP